jgi:hypothetical protein
MIFRVGSIISLTWTHSCQRPVLNNVKDQRPLPLSPRTLWHGFERTGRTHRVQPTRPAAEVEHQF